MKKINKQFFSLLLSLVLTLSIALPGFAQEESKQVFDLKIMSTTDIHTVFMNYDYYQDFKDEKAGFVKIASLIEKNKQENQNNLLFDNGDLIQGTPFGDYLARVKGLKDGDTYPMIAAMNKMKYDAASMGNHEFNYGLDFLQKVIVKADFPYINSNIYKEGTQEPFFKPYVILDRTFKDQSGKEVKLKVGVIGFVPPQIMTWDGANLKGKVYTKDIVETAQKYVPQMKKEGADLIVAVAHSGLDDSEKKGMDENSAFYLTQIKDIDVVISGHSHKPFPAKTYEGMKNVDLQKGTINNKPVVIAGAFADALGVIDLKVEKTNQGAKVIDSQTKLQPVFDKNKNESLAQVNPEVEKIFLEDHQKALEYIRGSVGEITSPIHSYFALVQDDPSVQLVNNAQKEYVKKKIKSTELEGLPVLSAAAPFKAGGRNGSSYYTNIPKGTIAIKNTADLYVYPNTLYVLKMKGSELKEWLEMASGQFNQVDINKKEEQSIVNIDYPTYNFDIIDGLTYDIDITKPAKYDKKGNVINLNSSRIYNLKYNNKEIDPNMEFLIATNNYRAGGGGGFPGITPEKIVIASPDENRQIIIDYIKEKKTIDPSADGNWKFINLSPEGNYTFISSPDAKIYANENIKLVSPDKDGFAKYRLIIKK